MTDHAPLTYEANWERNHYRRRCQTAIERIECEAGKITKLDGSVVALVLPVESWRSIRALLQQEPRVTPPEATDVGCCAHCTHGPGFTHTIGCDEGCPT